MSTPADDRRTPARARGHDNGQGATIVGAIALDIPPAILSFVVLGVGLGAVIPAREGQYNACLGAGVRPKLL